jgi:hypothetical protein
MPITLGILAQSRQVVDTGAFVLLESTVLTGSQASVEFTNLTTKYSATYQHLQLRLVARTTGNNGLTGNFLNMQFNGDTGNNYSMHQLQGNPGGINSAYFPDTSIYLQRITSAGNVSGDFGVIVTDILDAFETTKNKTSRSLGGIAAQTINLTSGSWRNTASLTSVLVKPSTDNFATGSRFSLYGIKATA